MDRTLIWNQAHLRQILRQYETHHNQHRPHRFLRSAAPLKPLPEPVDLDHYRVRRQARVGGLINEITWSHDVDEVIGTHNIQFSYWHPAILSFGWARHRSARCRSRSPHPLGGQVAELAASQARRASSAP